MLKRAGSSLFIGNFSNNFLHLHFAAANTWTTQDELWLLSGYRDNKDVLLKNAAKFWSDLTLHVNEKVTKKKNRRTTQQVKDKIGNLIKRYKNVVDNNRNKTGQAPKTCECYKVCVLIVYRFFTKNISFS